jgi:hypothetical protein
VIDFTSRGTRRADPTIRWRPVLLSPADGSIDFPLRFPKDSPTEPVSGAGRMGPPLIVRLADSKAEVADYAAELSRLSGRRATALETVPLVDAAHPGILASLPRHPLKRRTRYRIVHRFLVDGEEREVSAVFRTR